MIKQTNRRLLLCIYTSVSIKSEHKAPVFTEQHKLEYMYNINSLHENICTDLKNILYCQWSNIFVGWNFLYNYKWVMYDKNYTWY